MWFFFFSMLIMQIIYIEFQNSEPALYPCNEPYLVMVFFFYTLLNSICLYFVKDLYIYINTGIWIYSFFFVWPPFLFLLYRQRGYWNLFHSGWDVVVCIFQGTGLLHQSCQINIVIHSTPLLLCFVCKVYGDILYFTPSWYW